MKYINVEFESLTDGIPCELLLYMGNLLKDKEEKFIYLETNNENLNNILFSKISNFLRHYKIKNIIISKTKLITSVNYRIPNKLNLYFSPNTNSNNVSNNNILKNFINQFEVFFGTLPFYLENNKYIDKFLFINDILLQFGADIILH